MKIFKNTTTMQTNNGELYLRVLGIDPGLATVGFGIVEKKGSEFISIDYGIISTEKNTSLHSRLKIIYNATLELIDYYKPDCVAIEELFFLKNITTGIPVSHARGVILLACSQKLGDAVYEYTPVQIKMGITGYGRAEKKQMQFMTKSILNLKEVAKPDDAADALAVAICHLQTNQLLRDTKI